MLQAQLGLKRFLLGAVLAATCVFSIPAAAAEPLRKWKDATGKFEIEASFVKLDKGMVTLKKANGDLVEVALKNLPFADANEVEFLQHKAELEAKGGVPALPPEIANLLPGGAGTGPAPTSVDWKNAKVLPPATENRWKSISIAVAKPRKSKTTKLPAAESFFEEITGIVACDGFVLVSSASPAMAPIPGQKAYTRLYRVNPETGKHEGTIVVDGIYDLLDALPNGDQLLVRQRGRQRHEDKVLEIWRPAGKTVQRLKAFQPFPDPDLSHVQYAAFLNDQQIIVGADQQNGVGVIKIADGTPVWFRPNGRAAAVSPDRHYAAVLDEGLVIVDTATQQVLASIPTDHGGASAIAFSPDGQRIAVGSFGRLSAWNLSDGSPYRVLDDIGMPVAAATGLVWTSPTHILVSNGKLIDLERSWTVWVIGGFVRCSLNYGGATLLAADRVGEKFEAALVSTPLPHAKAIEAVRKRAAGAPNDAKGLGISTVTLRGLE